MYDIHCHILPEVDDGAVNLDMTRSMLQISIDQGIKGIIATPHYHGSMKDSIFTKWDVAFEETKKIATEIDPNFKIFRGAEIYYDSRIIEFLHAGAPITMNNSKFILIEFPPDVDISYIRYSVQELIYEGFKPIIAHVERYQNVGKLDNLRYLHELGALFQVNATSLDGNSGLKMKSHSGKLLKNSLIDAIGSDSHSDTWRSPQILSCKKILDRKVGAEKCHGLFSDLFNQITSAPTIGEELS